MKTTLQKLVKEELKAMIIEKANMSQSFRKAMEGLYDLELEQQELRKKFVAEKNPAKREGMKKSLVALHKKVKSAQVEFNKALATEPVDASIEESIKLNEGDDTKFTWKELSDTFWDMGMNTRKISNIRKALKNHTNR